MSTIVQALTSYIELQIRSACASYTKHIQQGAYSVLWAPLSGGISGGQGEYSGLKFSGRQTRCFRM